MDIGLRDGEGTATERRQIKRGGINREVIAIKRRKAKKRRGRYKEGKTEVKQI